MAYLLDEPSTKEVPQDSGYTGTGDVYPEYGYPDDLVENLIQQNPTIRLSTIDEIKKKLFGRKNAFAVLQRYDELTHAAAANRGYTQQQQEAIVRVRV
jgi:hypothetical protein